jgi:hypothetical protein
MFKKPTIVILGAGVSAEFGMPVGPTLLTEIGASVDRGRASHPRFIGLMHEKMGQERAARLLNTAPRLLPLIDQFDTIDEVLHFVSRDRDAVDLGKAAIAYQIAKAESDSLLSRTLQDKEAEKECDTTWAHAFLRIAMAGVSSQDFETYFNHVTIIDFNYDRVLKQYLYSTLQRLYGLAPGDAALCLKQLNVIRPYGSLGPLDWEGEDAYLAFGNQDVDLVAALTSIRTFTEENSSRVIQQIDRALTDARVCLVLGFGFHVQNIAMLSSTRMHALNPTFMTVYRMGNNAGAVTNAVLAAVKSNAPATAMDTTAYALMVQLKPSISIACFLR